MCKGHKSDAKRIKTKISFKTQAYMHTYTHSAKYCTNLSHTAHLLESSLAVLSELLPHLHHVVALDNMHLPGLCNDWRCRAFGQEHVRTAMRALDDDVSVAGVGEELVLHRDGLAGR